MARATRSLVLGTAGHIDHGKTALVRALTGIDTDRLPEEKRRGITIELGFAPWRPSERLHTSIVDVPGHEQFVRTMVAGCGGIDAVLLVVSAEDGVMPQTREHLSVCQLLEVAAGVVALTKVDRLADDPEAIELAVDDVRAALDGTPFADAPIVPCSAHTGQGIDALRRTLVATLQALPRRNDRGDPILCLDRVFSLHGHGTVVTGTLQHGVLDLGTVPSVTICGQSGARSQREVRVRGLEVHGESRTRASAGQRVALNLGGVGVDEVRRGDVVTRGAAVGTRKAFCASLLHLEGDREAWRAGTAVQVCVGTSHCVGRLDPLGGDRNDAPVTAGGPTIPAGREGVCLVRLAHPIPIWRAAKVIVRAFADASRERRGLTIGGGTILDPDPPVRRGQRARCTRLAQALQHDDAAVRAAALVADAGPQGLDVAELARRGGVVDLACLPAEIALPLGTTRVVAVEVVRKLVDATIAAVDRFHADHPLQAGMARATIEASLSPAAAADVSHAAVDVALGRGLLRAVDDHGAVCRPGRGLQPGAELPEHVQRVFTLYDQAGIEPPTLRQVEAHSGLAMRDVLEIVGILQRARRLVRVSSDLSFEAGAHARLVELAAQTLRESGALDVQALKGLTGLSRKFAVPFLEHLDELGVTLRRGDTRLPGPRAQLA